MMVVEISWAGVNLQTHFHLFKGGLGLLKKPVNDTFRELAFFFIIIHLQDLFKRYLVDEVCEIRVSDRAIFRLKLSMRLAAAATYAR
jgi:hypothetical protein